MSDAAVEAWFYHLEQSSLDQALPGLLEKTLARGWRALVRVRDPGLLAALDERLWTWRAESFLPHGTDRADHAADQPILLTQEAEANPNGAQVLFIVDGADPGEIELYARCLILFDGREEAAVAQARARWKDLKGRGHAVSYWKQSGRGWEKSA